ncbi:hypothetical protein [Jannaschia marina]|nr:hypothetical protein [Jannaschia marina]
MTSDLRRRRTHIAYLLLFISAVVALAPFDPGQAAMTAAPTAQAD